MKLPSENVMSVLTYAFPVNVEYLSYVPIDVIELSSTVYSLNPANPAKLDVPPNSRFTDPASFDTIVNLPLESIDAVYFPVAFILSIMSCNESVDSIAILILFAPCVIVNVPVVRPPNTSEALRPVTEPVTWIYPSLPSTSSMLPDCSVSNPVTSRKLLFDPLFCVIVISPGGSVPAERLSRPVYFMKEFS